MNFTLEIVIRNGQLANVTFADVTQVVTIGAALQAVDAARTALLSIAVAQPPPGSGDQAPPTPPPTQKAG